MMFERGTKEEAIGAARRENGLVFLYCLATAAAVLAFASYCSFLYPFQDWVDDNIFLTVGRGLMQGKVLYVDLFDHKGLYLYLLYGGMHLLFSPFGGNPFLGIYVAEALCGGTFLYVSYRICRLCSASRAASLCAIVPLACFVYGSENLQGGGSAEELLLPLFGYGIYALLRLLRGDGAGGGTFFRLGMCASVVLWVKCNLLGFWVGWCLAAGTVLWVRRSFSAAASRAALFLGGMALGSLPVFVYFALNGALGELFRIYFKLNLTGYAESGSMHVGTQALSLWKKIGYWCGSFYDRRGSFLVIFFGLWMLLFLRGRAECFACLVTFGAMTLLIYWGGKKFPYYFVPHYAFAPLVAAGVLLLLSRLRACVDRALRAPLPSVRPFGGRIGGFWAVACALLLCMTISLREEFTFVLIRKNVPRAQETLAEILREEQASLLCFCSYDAGLYNLSDTLPINNHFSTVNLTEAAFPEMWEEQRRMVAGRVTDYVLVCNASEELSRADRALLMANYSLVREATDEIWHTLSLWKRLDS